MSGEIAQLRNEIEYSSTSRTNKCFESQWKLRARIITDRSKSVLLLWFITVLYLCCWWFISFSGFTAADLGLTKANLRRITLSGDRFYKKCYTLQSAYKQKFWNPKHKLYYLNNLVISKQKYVDVIKITINRQFWYNLYVFRIRLWTMLYIKPSCNKLCCKQINV